MEFYLELIKVNILILEEYKRMYKTTKKKDLIKILDGLKLDILKKDELLVIMNKHNQQLADENVILEKELKEEKAKPVILHQSTGLDEDHILFLQERIKNSIHPHLVVLYQKELDRVLNL